MKLKVATDNGNLYRISDFEGNTANNWTNQSVNSGDSYNYHSVESLNFINNLGNYRKQFEEIENISTDETKDGADNITGALVCNTQYRLDNRFENLTNLNNKTDSGNLEGVTQSFLTLKETFTVHANDSTQSTPNDEERAFENSDSDEMSDKGIKLLPRGIVNPNYPGFQHLAHTLQDYSSTIENYYHSDNEMTDDDIDIEIADATYDFECKDNEMNEGFSIESNNNNIDKLVGKKKYISLAPNADQIEQVTHDIPDLLKTVSKQSLASSSYYDINCSDTDIENNFNTHDIIGDFNKEIEEEIKHVLNYNINIQDDIEALKKDIEENFTKPIENTINNISDVVNHVIKKLVETQCDIEDEHDTEEKASQKLTVQETTEKQNETNALREMHLSRPKFLLIENNINSKFSDAFLSDGKDELNINYENEYNSDQVSHNVENTIKQLSTELRKIIPKLDELREREKLFAVSKESLLAPLATDTNCNQIAKTSKSYNYSVIKTVRKNDALTKNDKENDVSFPRREIVTLRSRNSPRVTRDRTGDLTFGNASHRAHETSVQTKEDCDLGSFDVYNIETALPKLDIDAIESHLKAAQEAERRKHNDREEIRRRLAMGADNDEYYSLGAYADRPGKKPSLQSRLQSGKNLQICFMNETASDNESQTSDLERNVGHNKSLSKSSLFSKSNYSLNNHPYQTRPLSVNVTKNDKISTAQSGAKLRPSSLCLKTSKSRSTHSLGHIEIKESDFYALQATLQTEARIALAQAKEMARIQMERERHSRPASPVTEMLRRSMQKAGAPLAADRRRVSRHLLTDMNIAQLQVIVNELHSQIESLNEQLVQLLMARDELHMGQDSMLVDIEDLTRYLGVKEQTKKTKGPAKSAVRRLTSLVHK